MRSRLERKMSQIDERIADKRKKKQMETDLKSIEDLMVWEPTPTQVEPTPTQVEQTPEPSPQTSTESDQIAAEIQRRRHKKTTTPKNGSKLQMPKVKMSKRKETQSLLKNRVTFFPIGGTRALKKDDSAGHYLDDCHYLRKEQRIKILNALHSRDIPPGSMNTMSTAIRVESAIFRVLSQDVREYIQYCDQCSAFIKKKRSEHICDDLLLGRISPDDFAFLPSNNCQTINLRIKLKELNEKEKLKQLKKGIV